MVLSTESRPCCLSATAPRWSSLCCKPIQPCTSSCDSGRVGAEALHQQQTKKTETKEMDLLVFWAWTFGKNLCVKYATEPGPSECSLEFTAMALYHCLPAWILPPPWAIVWKMRGTSTETLARSSTWHTHLWPKAFIMHGAAINRFLW